MTDIVNINKSVTLLYSYKPNSYVRLWQNDKLFHKNIFYKTKSHVYIGKGQSEVLCIKDNGITRTFGSWNVFYQYVLADEVLYIAYGSILGTLRQRNPSKIMSNQQIRPLNTAYIATFFNLHRGISKLKIQLFRNI